MAEKKKKQKRIFFKNVDKKGKTVLFPDVKKRREANKKKPKKKAGGGWIAKAIKKPGSLRKTLGVKKGQKIPVSELKKAAEGGGKTARRARLALTLRKMNKRK